MIDRATRCLAEARTSAELLEAKAIAEAALHYAKLTKAANETQADCLRMIVRAEMRMADEIDRGQANGEVALPNQPVSQYVRAADIPPATYDDLGVSRQRVAEWRTIRDAGPDIVEHIIARALAEERAPTKADIHRAIGGDYFRTHYTGNVEWFTPQKWLEPVRATLGQIDLDPASCDIAQRQVRATAYYTKDDDGLSRPWHGRVFMNPPYGVPAIEYFIHKLLEELTAARVTEAVVLTNNFSDTRWFHTAAHAAAAICFTKGRVGFESPDGAISSPMAGQSFFYYGEQLDRFRAAFEPHGLIVALVRGAAP